MSLHASLVNLQWYEPMADLSGDDLNVGGGYGDVDIDPA